MKFRQTSSYLSIRIACKLVFFQLFAQACLRTLCVAVRSVPEASWEQWSNTLARSATVATCERDALLESLYDQMERELQVGSSRFDFFFLLRIFYLSVLGGVAEY